MSKIKRATTHRYEKDLKLTIKQGVLLHIRAKLAMRYLQGHETIALAIKFYQVQIYYHSD